MKKDSKQIYVLHHKKKDQMVDTTDKHSSIIKYDSITKQELSFSNYPDNIQ